MEPHLESNFAIFAATGGSTKLRLSTTKQKTGVTREFYFNLFHYIPQSPKLIWHSFSVAMPKHFQTEQRTEHRGGSD